MKSTGWLLAMAVGLAVPAAAELSLEERALKALQPPPEVRLSLRNHVPQQSMPGASAQWREQVLTGWNGPAPRVRLEAQDSTGRRSWVLAFDKQVQVQCWVARHSLQSGQLIEAKDFERQSQWWPAQIPLLPGWDWSQPGQMRIKRGLAAGAVLDARQLEPVPSCETGCSISVEQVTGSVRVTFLARAMERGYPGRLLRVRLDNGHQIQVWCDAQGHFRERTSEGEQR